MGFFKPTIRWIFLILALPLLLSIVFVYDAAAQVPDEPNIAPSATVYEGDIRSYEGPVIAEPGLDVPLGGTREPAIAVNPRNPANITMASLFRLRVSTDNGVSFTAPTLAPVPATHGRCGDPSLSFDTQGRLFWAYLGCIGFNADIFIAQVNPTTGAVLAGYPVNVTASAGINLPVSGGFSHDKEWLVADRFNGSPFQDRLYIVWSQFPGGPGGPPAGTVIVRSSFSANQGNTWSAPLTLSGAGEGFPWPSHNAVARNGDVYVTYHSQPTFAGGAPNGTSGQTFVLRSTDGGVTYPQKTLAFTGGNSDITFNRQDRPRTLNQSTSWTQGSAQPWVLPDQTNPNNVYVVVADDPNNLAHGAGNNDVDVFISRSTNQGVTWSAPTRIDQGPGASHQFYPTAAIDDNSQCLTVTWYDTRAGATNAAGNFMLDLFSRSSPDGGVTFLPEVQLNDVAFDPDLGAPLRFAGPPPTRRIGEYNGVAVANGIAHAVWTGNTAAGQQIIYDNTVACPSVFSAVDIYFLVDTSGSFSDDLPVFKAQATGPGGIISTLRNANPNSKFGVGTFEDYPISPFGSLADGDVAYRRDIDLTFDTVSVEAVITGLITRFGGDGPQSQLAALFQTATGAGQVIAAPFASASIAAGQQANFRDGATKIILLWTDASAHQPGDPGDIPYPGPTFAATISAILALDPPQVIGISSGGGGLADLLAIAAATDAFAPSGGVDCDGDGIIDIPEGEPLVCSIPSTGEGIGEAITTVVEAITLPTCEDDVLLSNFQTSPSDEQFVDITNVGNAVIDINNCSFTAYNVFTELSVGAATVALSGTLGPGETFRVGSALAPGVDAVIPDGAIPAGPGGFALLDASPPPDGTPVGDVLSDNITGMVYLNNLTVFGVSHLRVPDHDAVYDCIYGGSGQGPFFGPFTPVGACFDGF